MALPDPRFTLPDAQSFARSENERVLRLSIALQGMFQRRTPKRKDGMAIIDVLVVGYESRFGELPRHSRTGDRLRVVIGERTGDRILMPPLGTAWVKHRKAALGLRTEYIDPANYIPMIYSGSNGFWVREDGSDRAPAPRPDLNMQTEPDLSKSVAAFVVAFMKRNPQAAAPSTTKFIADYLRDREYRQPISQAEAQP